MGMLKGDPLPCRPPDPSLSPQLSKGGALVSDGINSTAGERFAASSGDGGAAGGSSKLPMERDVAMADAVAGDPCKTPN